MSRSKWVVQWVDVHDDVIEITGSDDPELQSRHVRRILAERGIDASRITACYRHSGAAR